MTPPNKSPEPTAVGAGSSAVAVHVASRRWLSLLNQQNEASSKLMDASAKGRHGTIALSPQGKQNVSQKVNAEPYAEIRTAIQELTTRRWTGF